MYLDLSTEIAYIIFSRFCVLHLMCTITDDWPIFYVEFVFVLPLHVNVCEIEWAIGHRCVCVVHLNLKQNDYHVRLLRWIFGCIYAAAMTAVAFRIWSEILAHYINIKFCQETHLKSVCCYAANGHLLSFAHWNWEKCCVKSATSVHIANHFDHILSFFHGPCKIWHTELAHADALSTFTFSFFCSFFFFGR